MDSEEDTARGCCEEGTTRRIRQGGCCEEGTTRRIRQGGRCEEGTLSCFEPDTPARPASAAATARARRPASAPAGSPARPTPRRATQPFHDPRHLPRARTLHVYLQQRQHQRSLAPLIARKQTPLKPPLPVLRHPQHQGPHPGLQPPLPAPVPPPKLQNDRHTPISSTGRSDLASPSSPFTPRFTHLASSSSLHRLPPTAYRLQFSRLILNVPVASHRSGCLSLRQEVPCDIAILR